MWTSPWWGTTTKCDHQVGVSTCLACHVTQVEAWLKGALGVVPPLSQPRAPLLPGCSPTGGLEREDTQGHLSLVGTSPMDSLYLHLQARRRVIRWCLGNFFHLSILLRARFLKGYPSPCLARTGQYCPPFYRLPWVAHQ